MSEEKSFIVEVVTPDCHRVLKKLSVPATEFMFKCIRFAQAHPDVGMDTVILIGLREYVEQVTPYLGCVSAWYPSTEENLRALESRPV